MMEHGFMKVYIAKDSHDILGVFDTRKLAEAYANGDCTVNIEEWEVDDVVPESVATKFLSQLRSQHNG